MHTPSPKRTQMDRADVPFDAAKQRTSLPEEERVLSRAVNNSASQHSSTGNLPPFSRHGLLNGTIVQSNSEPVGLSGSDEDSETNELFEQLLKEREVEANASGPVEPEEEPVQEADSDLQGENSLTITAPPVRGMPVIAGAASEKVLSGDGCGVTLNLATTAFDSKDKRRMSAQHNVLRALGRLRAYGVRSWVFTDSPFFAQRAQEEGVLVVSKFKVNKEGKPFLAQFYTHVAENDPCQERGRWVVDGFLNGDIVFTSSLVKTMLAIQSEWQDAVRSGVSPGVMVAGKRSNFDLRDQELKTEEDVLEILPLSRAMGGVAIDYFLYSRGAMPWSSIPPFVVGRPGYDNWLTTHAHLNLDQVDISRTVKAVHLTAQDGIFAGHKPGKDKLYNVRLMKSPGTEMRFHVIDQAHFRTRTEEDGRITIFTKGDKTRPNPVPPKSQEALVRFVGERAIFCATTGQSGSSLLHKLLGVFENTLAVHTPDPQLLLSRFRGAEESTRGERERLKLGAARRSLFDSKTEVYAETSPMFIKTFYDLDFHSSFRDVRVVVLRRWAPAVVKEHVLRGVGVEKFKKENHWDEYVATWDLSDSVVRLGSAAKELDPVDRMVYYAVDIEERIARLQRQLAGRTNTTIVEVDYEELVGGGAGALRRIFEQLGYKPTPEHLDRMLAIVKKPPKGPNKRGQDLSEGAAADRIWQFLIRFKVQVTSRSLAMIMQHPGARGAGSARVVAVAQVWQASEYIRQWLDQVLQYADAVVLVDDHSSDATVEIAQNVSGVSVLRKEQWSFAEEEAQLRGLREAVRLGATHIVCLDTDEILTANLVPYARSLILSLPPGKAIDLFLWHLWDGISNVIMSTKSDWGTLQRTFFAYRPVKGSENKWRATGLHHIGRLPAGVDTNPAIKFDRQVGGIIHFKYANHVAYRVKIDWYKMMEWRERRLKKADNGPANFRLASPAALSKFYASKWPRGVQTKAIPPDWVTGIPLHPFQRQELTRRVREEQLAVWQLEFNAQTVKDLIGSAVYGPGRNQSTLLRPEGPDMGQEAPEGGQDAAGLGEAVEEKEVEEAARPEVAREGNVSAAIVRFVMVVGIEGVGHHSLENLLDPDFSQLMRANERLRKQHLNLRQMLYNHENPGRGLFNYHCQKPDKQKLDVFHDVVLQLAAVAKTAAQHTPPAGHSVSIPLNLPDEPVSGMMSFPNFQGECRELQFPELEVLYRACDKAEVKCSHLLLLRDPYRALASTMRRHFDSMSRQIKILATMQAAILAQQLSSLGRPQWCWTFGETETREQMAQALGWEDMEAFQQVYEKHFKYKGAVSGDEFKQKLQAGNLRFLTWPLEKNYELVKRTCTTPGAQPPALPLI